MADTLVRVREDTQRHTERRIMQRWKRGLKCLDQSQGRPGVPDAGRGKGRYSSTALRGRPGPFAP